jgi:hypothetical protein
VLQPDGRRQSLFSSRDSRGEARRLVETWRANCCPSRDAFVVAFGLGCGQQLPLLLDGLGDGGTLLVMDRAPDAVRAVLEHVSLAELCAVRHDTNLQFIVHRDLDRFIDELGDATRQYMLRLNISLFAHPGALRAFPDAYRELTNKVMMRTRMEHTERNTLCGLSNTWYRNTMVNVPALVRNGAVTALRGAFAGVPAAVVAAGPSLEQSLPLLRQLQDRMLLIAVGTALKPLLAAGLTPHLVVSVDGCPDVWPQFRELPPLPTRLVAAAQTDPRILAAFEGRFFSYDAAFPGVETWLASVGAPSDRLPVGGTVALTAVALPRYLGCRSCHVFGLDLAYRDDGASHAAHSIYDGCRAQLADLVQVPGNWRDQVHTTAQFQQYIERVGEFAAILVRDLPVVNVNPDGARIAHLQAMKPGDLRLDDFPVVPDLWQRLDRCSGRPRGDMQAVRRAAADLVEPLQALHNSADEAAAVCRNLLREGLPRHDRERLLDRLRALEDVLREDTMAAQLVAEGLKGATLRTLSFYKGDAADEKAFAEAIRYCGSLYKDIAAETAWARTRLRSIGNDDAAAPPCQGEMPYGDKP